MIDLDSRKYPLHGHSTCQKWRKYHSQQIPYINIPIIPVYKENCREEGLKDVHEVHNGDY